MKYNSFKMDMIIYIIMMNIVKYDIDCILIINLTQTKNGMTILAIPDQK